MLLNFKTFNGNLISHCKHIHVQTYQKKVETLLQNVGSASNGLNALYVNNKLAKFNRGR
jgi:hypothetical protein